MNTSQSSHTTRVDTGLVQAAANEPHRALKGLAKATMAARKTLPSFEQFDYDYKELVRLSPRWRQALVNVADLMRRSRAQLKKMVRNSEPPLARGQVRKWVGHFKVIEGLIRPTTTILADDDWVPDPEAGEATNPDYENVVDNLELITGTLWSMYLNYNQEAERLTVEARRRANNPVKSTPVTKPKGKRASKAIKLNEWQDKHRGQVFDLLAKVQADAKPQEPKAAKTASAKPKPKPRDVIAEPTNGLRAKAQQQLLEPGESWGIVDYTVAADAWISKHGQHVLDSNPYHYEPEYVGGTTHTAIGLNSCHEPGFWYLREALVLGVADVDTMKDLTAWVQLHVAEDPDVLAVMSQVRPHINPVYRSGHYYWLLLPNEQAQIEVYDWDLVDR